MGGQGGCLHWTTKLVLMQKKDHSESQLSGASESQGPQLGSQLCPLTSCVALGNFSIVGLFPCI